MHTLIKNDKEIVANLGRKNNDEDSKTRYWEGILYPESMIDNWEEEISGLIQLPYAYCLHDKDKLKNGEPRKPHIHLIIVWSNTTTYNAALKVFQRLGDCNKIERVLKMQWAYDYLLHDTEDAKKKGKYLYLKEERILGNNFDIGAYIQLDKVDKFKLVKHISSLIRDNDITNYSDLEFMVSELDSSYYEVFLANSGHFERLCKGLFLKNLRSDKNEQ